MRNTAVLNVVGLTPSLIGDATPNLRALIARGRLATIREVTPAVTCTAQATYLTGKPPSEHGIVGNGWYFRDTSEIRFWHQSNKLVLSPPLWETLRKLDPSFTCANLCWWFAMYSSCDFTVTPRPQYPADGRKFPDCWTQPPGLRDLLTERLGSFPLFQFWGPATSIAATRWIADAAMIVDRECNPTLSLIYLPHLDYNLQRLGPTDPAIAKDLCEVDLEIGRLVAHFAERNTRVVVLSEYGITAVRSPIHINRILREMNLLSLRIERGRELLDAGASQAFAVADHQIAHVYVNQGLVKDMIVQRLRKTPGIAKVYTADQRRTVDLDHDRAGDIIALAEPDAWFTYYYWLDDAKAPDFARTVDIHRKPGYDPAELCFDPTLAAPKLKVAATLLRRKLGMRALLNVIGLDASVVKGSHGTPAVDRDDRPVFIGDRTLIDREEINAADVHDLLRQHVIG